VFELALMMVPGLPQKERTNLQRSIHQLRRYPIKSWLSHDAPTF
jgi:hypothetical protein